MFRPTRIPNRGTALQFLLSALVLAATLTTAAAAQQPTPMDDMPGMDMGHANAPHSTSQIPSNNQQMSMQSTTQTLPKAIENHTSSGTGVEPISTPADMWMSHKTNGWMLMLHGTAFVTDQQQSGPRGADKLFSTNWLMPMIQKDLRPGQRLTLRAMFSLEPATITGRYFPELFQQGETAFGHPILNGQHPHDLFMELAAIYDISLTTNTLISIYAAPIGDPAIGPIAYPHRASAAEDPLATLGHHQQDSTHIAFNVLTAGLTWRFARIEASGFHGAEPTESRWQPEPSANGHAIDSNSLRLTLAPTRNLTGQYSIAHIKSPEALSPGEDQSRQTASLSYHRGFTPQTTLDATALWGRTKSLPANLKQNSYLLEALFHFHRNAAWIRLENAARTNELLLPPDTTPPPSFNEAPIGHVAAYTFGYDRDYPLAPHLAAAAGAQFTFYNAPAALAPTYTQHPIGAAIFIRFRITQ